MSPPCPEPTDSLDPARLQQVLGEVRAQVSAALWLSAGMVLVLGIVVCAAAGLRRPALALGLLYFITLCFVPNGHAQVLGPVGAAAAAAGMLLPARRP